MGLGKEGEGEGGGFVKGMSGGGSMGGIYS